MINIFKNCPKTFNCLDNFTVYCVLLKFNSVSWVSSLVQLLLILKFLDLTLENWAKLIMNPEWKIHGSTGTPKAGKKLPWNRFSMEYLLGKSKKIQAWMSNNQFYPLLDDLIQDDPFGLYFPELSSTKPANENSGQSFQSIRISAIGLIQFGSREFSSIITRVIPQTSLDIGHKIGFP